MMSRTQITLDPAEHKMARLRAAEQGISLAEYIRRLVHLDLTMDSATKVNVSALFDLGDSGGSDITNHKHEYIGEALDAAHPRR